jgi:phosphatidate cytidylyltransferase
MLAVFALILYSDHILVSLFVIVLQCVVFREMIAIRYRIAKERGLSQGFRILHWYFLFGTFFYVYGPAVLNASVNLMSTTTLQLLLRYHLAISFALYVIGFVGFIFTLKKPYYKYQFGQLTWTLMTLLLVVGQSHVIIQNVFRGLIWLVLPASLIVCNDVWAYFFGLAFGHRWFQRGLTSLSPKKTWEGFAGALITTILFGFLFSGILAQFDWMVCPRELSYDQLILPTLHCTHDPIFIPTPYPLPSWVPYFHGSITIAPIQLHSLVFSLFASLIAPFGGFFASGIKRAYSIKDFDTLFPGHGGMTDRMDCQFIQSAFTYVYLNSILRTAPITVASIIAAIAQLPHHQQLELLHTLQNTIKP